MYQYWMLKNKSNLFLLFRLKTKTSTIFFLLNENAAIDMAFGKAKVCIIWFFCGDLKLLSNTQIIHKCRDFWLWRSNLKILLHVNFPLKKSTAANSVYLHKIRLDSLCIFVWTIISAKIEQKYSLHRPDRKTSSQTKQLIVFVNFIVKYFFVLLGFSFNFYSLYFLVFPFFIHFYSFYV